MALQAVLFEDGRDVFREVRGCGLQGQREGEKTNCATCHQVIESAVIMYGGSRQGVEIADVFAKIRAISRDPSGDGVQQKMARIL